MINYNPIIEQNCPELFNYLKKNNIELQNEMNSYKAGDIVTFTNDYGVKFENLMIFGFRQHEDLPEHCVYIHKDSYWFPVRLNQINK